MQPYRLGLIILLLQMQKSMFRKAESLIWIYFATMWKSQDLNPGTCGSKAQGLSRGHSGWEKCTCDSSFKTEVVLEFNPYHPTCWEDRPWSHSLEFGVHCAKSLLYGTHHMEPRIHHSLWQAAWPGNHPEGYILIRELAAVFQSHYWNFIFYFIFSKPACPSFFQPVFSFPWCSGLSR